MITTIKGCLFASLLFASAGFAGGGHPHGDEEHDDHGHSDEVALAYTHHTESTELFVEFPPLVVNEASTFVAHFTRMDNFQPLTSGIVDVHLRQEDKTVARFRVRKPASRGLFLPAVTVKKAGDYELWLEVRDGDLHSVHELGVVTVFASREAAVVSGEETAGEISYLKEQQWDNPFAIERVRTRPLRPSVAGFATVMAPPDDYAVVRAPSDGYFSAQTFINAGEQVELDQLLGHLVPRLGEGADIGNLLVAQERARSQYQLAQADAARLQDLFDQGAIPEKRLLEARQALDVAEVELQTAQSRLQQRSGKQGSAGIALRAPIGGEVVDVGVRPGAFVRSGDELFTLAGQTRRWLHVQVPEKFSSQIHKVQGAWLLYGQSTVVLDGDHNARVAKVAQQVEPRSRTVAIAIEYPSAVGPQLLGARLPAQVYVGEPKLTLSIPASALIDDGGRPVVYVQTGGESFSRRPVNPGIRDGEWVEILSGVEAEEWVVSNGAYYVKLASTGGDAIGHGHAH